MDYQKQVEEIESTAKFGDMIEFSYPIGYSHWGVYDEDGHVIHFAVADEGQLMNRIRTSIESWLPVCGDFLIRETKIRRVPLGEVNVPKGAHVLISNNRHFFTPSSPEDMRQRRDALLDKVFTYNLFSLNCEHFATFVRYGKAVCNQIPARTKNLECEDATAAFQKVIDSAETSPEDE
ncbi:phospholipase A and acyltransferase 2-like [Plectropomus leopardus]|uniref:phospholipase A and acyltransferase 2-like n=1 Tax=Plectropomus leopardus TaxID=160734 RepID=UPI001C4BB273|nr:phospholipase A and acyltransferase 2-like [Plectropomus leopardus]XP_042369300.1 phospholipase A and acyltransferase 2-like [Plectropomus leopardus]